MSKLTNQGVGYRQGVMHMKAIIRMLDFGDTEGAREAAEEYKNFCAERAEYCDEQSEKGKAGGRPPGGQLFKEKAKHKANPETKHESLEVEVEVEGEVGEVIPPPTPPETQTGGEHIDNAQSFGTVAQERHELGHVTRVQLAWTQVYQEVRGSDPPQMPPNWIIEKITHVPDVELRPAMRAFLGTRLDMGHSLSVFARDPARWADKARAMGISTTVGDGYGSFVDEEVGNG